MQRLLGREIMRECGKSFPDVLCAYLLPSNTEKEATPLLTSECYNCRSSWSLGLVYKLTRMQVSSLFPREWPILTTQIFLLLEGKP